MAIPYAGTFTIEEINLIKPVQDKRNNNRSQAIPDSDGPSRRRRRPTEKKLSVH